MKRALALAFCLALFLAGCSQSAGTGAGLTENETSNLIEVSVRDVQQITGQFSRYVAEVTNISDKYLTGIIDIYASDQNNKPIGKTTIFLNNLSPNDFESNSLLIPIEADVVEYKYDIIRLFSSDTPAKSPEITSDNLYDYIYLTYNDYNDIAFNKKSVTANVHNLTAQYFSGKITVTVKDKNGSVLTQEVKEVENMNPYSSTAIVLLFDITNDYNIEYKIDDYSFTDSPQ